MRTRLEAIGEARAAAIRGDFESAIVLLRPLAASGDPEAQYQLGSVALTECDLMSGCEAFSLLRAAAGQGHAEAMYHLATFPDFAREPFTSPLSGDEAWVWLIRAAESGCVQAQYEAGASLATGDWADGAVVSQQPGAAVAWDRRAAEAGHAEARFNLVSLLMEGDGCERDLAEAKNWLCRSVAGGYAHAGELLAHLESLAEGGPAA